MSGSFLFIPSATDEAGRRSGFTCPGALSDGTSRS